MTKWARSIYGRVGFLLHQTFEKWELGFMRDTHPQVELLIWEAIAQAYESYVSDHPECDKKLVCSWLASLSTGHRSKEAEYPEGLRAHWEKVFAPFAKDREGKFRETWDRLNLGEA